MVRPDRPHLPDEYLREIGQIAVAWNGLENSLLNALVFALLDRPVLPNERALAVFAHIAFPQKLDALESMLRLLDEKLTTIYCEKVKSQLKQAQEKRNTVLHQVWFAREDGVKRRTLKARGKLEQQTIPVNLQELVDISSFIRKAGVDLLMLIAAPLFERVTPSVKSDHSKGNN